MDFHENGQNPRNLLNLIPTNFNPVKVEDKPVADRLLEIWPNIVKTVNYWTSLMKPKQPKCKSVNIVSKTVNDVLTPLKLSFFSYMASLFHPFLKNIKVNCL